MPIRVLIADDHEAALHAIGEILVGMTEFNLVGKAATAHHMIQLARELSPEVVLMDVSLAGAGSEQAVQELLCAGSSIKVIAVSMHREWHFVEKMRAAGAVGYLLKEHVFDELREALLAVTAGKTFTSRWVPEPREQPGGGAVDDPSAPFVRHGISGD